MDFFKYFDWPRKVTYDNGSGAPTGNLVYIDSDLVTSTPSTDATVEPFATLFLECSGRPVQLSFESIFGIIRSGGVDITSGLSRTEFYYVLRVKRNGVQIKYDLATVFYPQGSTPATDWFSKLSQFNFIDLYAPAGKNRYDIDLIVYTPFTYNIRPTKIICLEL